MPYALAVGDYVRVRLWSSDGSQAAVNTTDWIVVGDDGSSLTDQNVADFFDTTVSPNYYPLLNNTATYRGVQAIRWSVPSSIAAVANLNTHVGTAGATACPTQVCGLVQWHAASAGRKYRGRNYIPFPATASVATDGSPSTAYITLLQTFAAWMGIDNYPPTTGPSGFGQIRQVIVHGGKAPPVAGAELPSPVLQATVSARWATQRKRGMFGRLNVSPV
jgi:hypothetical protein